ncbi:MAG: hypothetical protein MUC29_10200 [Pyrinomonadaceae bacterium]|nr:hypothetical protein [Pyrinomonadaceae bacterium]
MAKVLVASLIELASMKGGDKELYIVSFATDKRKIDNPIDNANLPSALDKLIPKLATANILKRVTLYVSPIFERAKKNENLPIFGDGLTLYEADPNGFFEISLAVMESDSGHANLEKSISGKLDTKEVNDLVGKLPAVGTIPTSALTGLATKVAGFIINATGNDDVLISSVTYSGRKPNYGINPPDTSFTVINFQNSLVRGKIKFQLIDEDE